MHDGNAAPIYVCYLHEDVEEEIFFSYIFYARMLHIYLCAMIVFATFSLKVRADVAAMYACTCILELYAKVYTCLQVHILHKFYSFVFISMRSKTVAHLTNK